jgi:DNA-binding NarL/FixJ family response regulator
MNLFADTAAAVSKVVIVEDSLNIQIALKLLIESVSSFRVEAVESTAATAIDWAKRHPGAWDIAVVDLMLAEGDGFEVIRRFASQPDRGHIIVYSAYVTPVIDRYCRELGANAVFPKEAAAKMAAHIENLHLQGY